jgi:tetratricopeptide (TPR) repeat protein
MNISRILLLSILYLTGGGLVGQSFEKCDKYLAEVLPEFNRAIESRDPRILQSKSYRNKVKKLRNALLEYQEAAYSQKDSISRFNNEAVMFALSGDYQRASQRMTSIGEPTQEVLYHRGLIYMLLGEFESAYPLLAANTGWIAENNAIVSRGSRANQRQAVDGVVSRVGDDPEGKLTYNQGVLFARDGNWKAAQQFLTKALERREVNLYRKQLGNVLLAAGNPEEALKAYVKLDKKEAESKIYQGGALIALGRFLEATQVFSDYLESDDPKHRGYAYLGLGQAYFGVKNYAEARRYYSLAARTPSLSIVAQCGMANVALADRKYTFARSIYDRLLLVDSTFYRANLGRAMARYGLGDHAGALEDFRKADRLIDRRDKEMADVLVCRGYAHYYSGNSDAAEQDFKSAVLLDSRRYQALAGLGKIEIDRRKFSEAGKYLSEALQHTKDHDRLWSNYGNLLLHFGMFDKAHAVFKTAVQLNPSNVHAQNGWGITLLERDKLNESRILFDSLLKTNPGRPFLLNNRGVVHAYLGNRYTQYQEQTNADQSYRNAEKDFDRAIEYAPTRKFYFVNKGNVFRYWNLFEEARLSYQTYQDKSALNNTAVLLAGLDKVKDAQYYLGVAIQIDSTHRVFQYNRKLISQGNAKEMARFVASAKDSGPYSDISIKYSLDGYVTIYLYDYEYENMPFPGRHHLSLPFAPLLDDHLLPAYDFSLMAYSEDKKEVSGKRKTLKAPKRIRQTSSKKGTKCPVLF